MEEACGKEWQTKPYSPSQLEDLVLPYTSTAGSLAYLWLLEFPKVKWVSGDLIWNQLLVWVRGHPSIQILRLDKTNLYTSLKEPSLR